MPTCFTNPSYRDIQVEIDDGITLDADYNPDYPFGESKETFNEKFWQDVKDLRDLGEIDKLTAVRTIRVKCLAEATEGDVLIDLITTKHDNYLHWCRTNNGMDKFETFVFELSQLASLILRKDFTTLDPQYLEKQHEMPDDTTRLVLHLAAERNLTTVMELILAQQKNLSAVTTYPDDNLPLYYALQRNHDEAASMIIRHMPNEYVRDIFEDSESEDYQFSNIITSGGMKKTIEAILDCLMNPDWPFLPSGDSEEEEGIILPNIPFRYHFYYRLLDGDQDGQPGIVDGKLNPNFNQSNSKSCLHLLAENSTFEDATIRHPVVRMLMRCKWNKFGRFWIRMNLLFYLVFLAVMSVAFLADSSTPNRREYTSHLDKFRLFCEIVTLLFTLIFITSEMDEVRKDKMAYLYDVFNYLDILGLVLILAVIPLRFTGCMAADFGVSAAAYLINFLRIGKNATAFKSMSIYLKTFARIITQEISKFLGVFAIFMLSFAGAVYLALKASKSELLDGKGYWFLFLQEVRSIAEANGLGETDEYTAMHVVVLILVMCNMFFCIVVLNNILIGQIGNSFSQASMDATIQYDIDRTKLVTRIEAKGFGTWNLRAAHYVDKEFLTNEVLENDLLEDWIMLKEKTKDKTERKEYIKGIISNKLRLDKKE